MINISLNKELDYEVCVDFFNFSVAGVDFGEKIKKDHPDLNLKNYKSYIDNFYSEHESEILNKQKEIIKLIEENQGQFLFLLKNMFDVDFTDINFLGYLSIFNCNPRYLDTRTFQIYYKKDSEYMLEVVFHESLHFAFFEYLDKNFSEKIKDMDKNSGVLWEMSEIINVIILNLPAFRKILGVEELLFYPELQNKLNKAKEIWDSCNGVKMFVTKYLSEFNIV